MLPSMLVEGVGVSAFPPLGRTALTVVNDAAYTVVPTDVNVAYATLTASRVITLPALANMEPGQVVAIYDESNACSTLITLTLNTVGSDLFDSGLTSYVLNWADASAVLVADPANGKWHRLLNTWPVPWTVANGGTGLATITPHNVLVGNGTSPLTRVAPGAGTGTAGVLASTGASTDPSFQDIRNDFSGLFMLMGA